MKRTLATKDFTEAKTHAFQLSEERGLAYIDGYDDPAIITGQGTMGLEIIEQVPDLDAIVIGRWRESIIPG